MNSRNFANHFLLALVLMLSVPVAGSAQAQLAAVSNAADSDDEHTRVEVVGVDNLADLGRVVAHGYGADGSYNFDVRVEILTWHNVYSPVRVVQRESSTFRTVCEA
ncbi:MAG: hypothetical protein IH927_05360, partial [Proteobacteria bacterium]|nr:hypothetical protein [Pseudomonadota bacterium]